MLVDKQLIECVRRRFFEEFEENPIFYYIQDVDRIINNDWAVERFALVHKKEDATLKALIKAMKWRKEFGLLDRTDQDFPLELYQAGIFNNYLQDKEGRQVLMLVGQNFFKSDISNVFKQFYFHQVEKIDSQTSNQGWGHILSNKNCGLANIDIDMLFWVISTFQDYYPRGYKYIMVVDVPFILSAPWKILANFMNEEFRKTFQIISREKMLEEYVDSDKTPSIFGGTCEKSYVWMPEDVRPLDKMPQLGLTNRQIEKIRSVFKDIFKENGF